MKCRFRSRTAAWTLVCLVLAASHTGVRFSRAFAQTDAAQQALVRFLHVAPDAPPVDIYVDGQLVVRRAEFPSATGFVPFGAGERRFQVTPAGSTLEGALIDIEQDLEDGLAYEFAAIGLLNDIEGAVYEVDVSELATPAVARIRVIHVAPNAGSLDIVNGGGEALFVDLEFPEAGDYRDVSAAPTDIIVRPTAESTDLARLDAVPIQAGWSYDVFVVGQRQNETLRFFAVKAPTVAPCGVILGTGPIDAVCAQVIHAASAPGPLWVFLDDGGEPIAGPILPGTVAPFVALPAGEHRLRFVPDGASPDEAIVEATLDQSAGEAVTVLVVPDGDGVEVSTATVDLGALPEGQARVRIGHALEGEDPIDVVFDDGTLLAEGLTTGESSEEVAVAAGTLTLALQVSGDEAIVLPQFEVDLEAGQGYELIVLSRLGQAQPEIIVASHPTISMAEREGIERAAGDGATPAASPEIVPTPSPTVGT